MDDSKMVPDYWVPDFTENEDSSSDSNKSSRSYKFSGDDYQDLTTLV